MADPAIIKWIKKIFIFTFDVIAKLLLAWFLFETFRYFYTGRFLEQIGSLQNFGRAYILMDIHSVIQIPVAAIGAIVFISLLLKGYKSGLVICILYWIMCYITNPLYGLIVFGYFKVVSKGH